MVKPEHSDVDETEAPASVEVENRLMEDAIAEGLARLGISREAAKIEILDEGKGGFLGIGAKNARVRVSRLSSQARTSHGRTSHARTNQAKAGRDTASPARISRDAAGPIASGQDATNHAATIETILSHLVTPIDEGSTIASVVQKGGRYECEIAAENIALLLGRRGRTLDAIQSLANAIAARKIGERVNIHLDSGGFREKRREVLLQMAADAAAEAISSGEEIHLEPMTSHDRKIIHAALTENHDVTTESEDSGDRRHIVVMAKSASGSTSRRRSSSGRSGGGGRSTGGCSSHDRPSSGRSSGARSSGARSSDTRSSGERSGGGRSSSRSRDRGRSRNQTAAPVASTAAGSRNEVSPGQDTLRNADHGEE